jgi:hypothetical protein
MFFDKKWLTISVLAIILSIQTAPVFSENQLSATQSVTYANELISINNSINYSGPIYAFAISIHLPDDVIFILSKTNSIPVIQPQKGDTDTLEFIWITPPESPVNLMYSVKSTVSSGIIQSKVIYRRNNGTLYYDLPDVQIMP